MKLSVHSHRIFFSLLLCVLCTADAGLSDTFRRWFPRQPVKSSLGRPSNLRPFVGVTEQDERLFNETLDHILVPRVPGTDSHAKVAQYIVDYMRKYDWHIEEDKFRSQTPMGQKPFNNIIATFNPDGCKKVIVACHYDSKYFADFEFLAASDSAVPCTMMLELARILDGPLKKSMPKDVALQFVFFDGEEAWVQWSRMDSTYGSRHLAAKWKKEAPKTNTCPSNVKSELARIDLFMLLDLIGEKDSTFCNSYRQAAPFYSHLMDIEHRLRRNSLMEGYHSGGGFFQRPFCGFNSIEDDQLPFEMNGVRKILHLISVPFPQVWHQKGDDASMIHHPSVNNLMKVFRVFLIEHLNLKM